MVDVKPRRPNAKESVIPQRDQLSTKLRSSCENLDSIEKTDDTDKEISAMVLGENAASREVIGGASRTRTLLDGGRLDRHTRLARVASGLFAYPGTRKGKKLEVKVERIKR